MKSIAPWPKLIVIPSRLPLPPSRKLSEPRGPLLRQLWEMEVGKCVAVNRTPIPTRAAIQQFRERYDSQRRYIVRKHREAGWCNIWRVK
jgi:hypothetical protein